MIGAYGLEVIRQFTTLRDPNVCDGVFGNRMSTAAIYPIFPAYLASAFFNSTTTWVARIL